MRFFIILLLVVIGLIIILMGLFAFLANKYYILVSAQKVSKILDESVYHNNKKPTSQKPQDHLSKDKVQEKKEEEALENAVIRYDPTEETSQRISESVKIVDIVKPVGFWSRFIMNQKLGYILARTGVQQDTKKGYWVNLIKAQAMSKSKEQSRGR